MDWAVNKTKLARAIQWVDEQVKLGKLPKATEEAVKEKYIALAGLVVESGQDVKEVIAEKVAEIKIAKVEAVKKASKKK